MSEAVRVDFSNRKTDTKTSILGSLKPGESYIHDHTAMRTPFSVWIATRRSRMGMKFSYSTTDTDGTKLPEGWYRIYLPAEESKS